jgi:hypothetical protein
LHFSKVMLRGASTVLIASHNPIRDQNQRRTLIEVVAFDTHRLT